MLFPLAEAEMMWKERPRGGLEDKGRSQSGLIAGDRTAETPETVKICRKDGSMKTTLSAEGHKPQKTSTLNGYKPYTPSYIVQHFPENCNLKYAKRERIYGKFKKILRCICRIAP